MKDDCLWKNKLDLKSDSLRVLRHQSSPHLVVDGVDKEMERQLI